MRHFVASLALSSAVVVAPPAQAEIISLTGAVVNLCVLAVTPGTLGVTTEGNVLSTEGTGGIPAVLVVTATGAEPTISFGVPGLSGPSGSTTGAVKELSFTSPGGASQTYTSSNWSYVMRRLLDTVTIRGKVTNAAGFSTGTYGLSSTVTCQQ